MSALSPQPARWMDATALGRLFELLRSEGYQVVGPTVREGAIVYDELATPDDLPLGVGDEQGPGHYRLRDRGDGARFGYAVSPHSWKRYLFPAKRKLFEAHNEDGQTRFEAPPPPTQRYAFFGARACELAAVKIQDQVFLGQQHQDPYYAAVRRQSLFIGVDCHAPAGTCFCVSMDTGPAVKDGFDLRLTEWVKGSDVGWVVHSGSSAGEGLLARLALPVVDKTKLQEAEQAVEAASSKMGRTLNTDGLPQALVSQPDHPQWAKIAERCMACANCTLACPTCFCSTVEDTGDLTGDHAERWRRWDSCFHLDFTHMHGGSARVSTQSRYRQWMTHKLSTWHDQFGSSGCVGCGRCVTWCPVGIDITEEAAIFQETTP